MSTATDAAGQIVSPSDQIPRSDVGVYFEAAGWLYRWDHCFNRRQFDTTWSAGVVVPLRTLIRATRPRP